MWEKDPFISTGKHNYNALPSHKSEVGIEVTNDKLKSKKISLDRYVTYSSYGYQYDNFSKGREKNQIKMRNQWKLRDYLKHQNLVKNVTKYIKSEEETSD